MTDDPDYTPFHVARTPSEANLVRALLDGAGIPAHVEGGMLADEFAVSQRLMNAQGVRVFVRRDDIERAREVLAEARVSEAELEQQAMAAAGSEGAELPLPPPPSVAERAERSPLPSFLTVLFALLTIVFFALWVQARSEMDVEDPLYTSEIDEDGLKWRWRHNGADAHWQIDRNRDMVFEEVRSFDRDGQLLMVSHDADANGLWERVVEHRADGVRCLWLDDDGDGRFDRCRVEDADGRLLRELRYAGVAGFVEGERR